MRAEEAWQTMEEPEALEAWDLESLAMMRRMTMVTMKKCAPYEAPGKAPVYASHPICAHQYFALLIQPPPNV